MRNSSAATFFVLAALLLVLPRHAAAGDQKKPDGPFSFTINTLVFAAAQYPAQTTQNRDNAFLNLYRYSTELDLRPDFFWEQQSVSALFKPRVTASRSWWEDGAAAGREDSLSRAFVNEWRVQVSPSATMFFSFGREKLLWGPSFIASPSNILFKDTEKANPKAEVEGKYLAKAMVVPNNAVTITLLAETQHETNELQQTLKPVRAIKADLMGSAYQISAIGYHQQDERARIGSFGQWTASDAVILYYDGIVSKGNDMLYPVDDPAEPLSGTFAKKYDDSGRLFAVTSAGGSYTFLAGPTLNLEFLVNGPGYNDAEAHAYYRLRQQASNHLYDAGALSGLSRATLNESLNTGSQFLRRYYLMGQVQFREIANALDVYLRYVHGLEENAGQASTIAEWRFADHASLFNINTVGVGGRDTEFRALIDRSFMAGVEVHF